jgi:DNA-binding XRE family transcriptional regulator
MEMIMDRDISFGSIVKEHRQSLDLTQAELARRVACATITMRKIEYDALRPSIQIAERLASSAGVSGRVVRLYSPAGVGSNRCQR